MRSEGQQNKLRCAHLVGGAVKYCRERVWQGRERETSMGDQFGPARIEKRFQTVAGLADGRVVLVERDAIDKHELQVGAKVVPRLVSAEIQKI